MDFYQTCIGRNNSMQQSRSWEANSSSAGEERPSILRHIDFYYLMVIGPKIIVITEE